MTQRCPEKEAAKARGDIRYRSTTPCINGHLAERYVRDGSCVPCGKIAAQKFAHSPKGVAYRKKWRSQPHVRERDREYAVRFSKRYRYGMNWDQFQAMLDRAGGKCEVCRKPFEHRSQRNGACIDHNHETGEIRGLLCHSCNRAIGLLGDCPERLEKMILYLRGVCKPGA